MSLPFYSIRCTGCDYSGRYAFNVRYQVEGVNYPINGVLTQGWCEDCDKVLTIYSPSSFSAEKAQNEIDERREIITNLTKSLFGKFVKKISSERKEQLAIIESDIDTLKKWSLFIKNNKIKDCCLTCGSASVRAVTLPSDYSTPTRIGVDHSCGGEIVATSEGRINYGDDCPKVICDIDGKILHDER